MSCPAAHFPSFFSLKRSPTTPMNGGDGLLPWSRPVAKCHVPCATQAQDGGIYFFPRGHVRTTFRHTKYAHARSLARSLVCNRPNLCASAKIRRQSDRCWLESGEPRARAPSPVLFSQLYSVRYAYYVVYAGLGIVKSAGSLNQCLKTCFQYGISVPSCCPLNL